MQTRLKNARKQLGYSQAEFAEKLGMTQQAYCMLEKGKNPITERHLKPICAIFNLNEQWLKTGKGDMFAETKRLAHFEDILKDLNEEQLDYLLDFATMLKNRQTHDPTPTTGEGE